MKSPNRYLLTLLGLCLMAWALQLAGIGKVMTAIGSMSALSIAGAALAVVAGTILGARNLYDIAELRGVLGFLTFLGIFWRSWAIGISLPGQVADMFSTAWQLKRYRASHLPFIASRILADKLVTVACMAATAACVPFLTGQAGGAFTMWALAAIFAAGLAAWLGARYLRDKLPAPARGWRLVHILLDAAGTPTSLVLRNLALTGLKMALTGLTYWLLLREITPVAPSYLATTAIALGAGLVAYVPVSFNGLGTVEVSAMALFALIDVSGQSVLGVYLVLRGLTLTLAWLPSLLWPPLDRQMRGDDARPLG